MEYITTRPEVILSAFILAGTGIGMPTFSEAIQVPGILNPNYTVTIESIIDPLDYGAPVNSFCGQDRIGAASMFVYEGEEERWRIILLLRDRIVIVEEGMSQAREIPLDFTPTRLLWSESGSYAAALSGERQGGVVDIRFVNLTEDSEGSFQVPYGNIDRYTIMNSGKWVQNLYDGFLIMNGADGQVDSISEEELSTDYCCYASHEDIIVAQAEPLRRGGGYRYNRILTALDMEFDTLWTADTGRYGPHPSLSSHGRYLMYGSNDGLVCLDGHSGQPLFTGLIPFEVKAPVISPGEEAWVAASRYNTGDFPSRVILGWFDTTRPMSTIFEGSTIYWANEKIWGVSDSGRTIIWKSADHVYHSAAWIKLLDPEGEVIWDSGTLSMLEGNLQPVFNHGEQVVLALSASGDRLIYSDYQTIYVLSIQ